MQIRSFDNLPAARRAANQAAANVGAVALPVVGTQTMRGSLSCFVEVPMGAADVSDAPTGRTMLQLGSYSELMLSFPEMLSGDGVLGFLVAGRPLALVGEHLQHDDADQIVAFVEKVMPATGTGVVGPYRCLRCNAPIPPGRSRILGPEAYCTDCQSVFERGYTNVQYR